MASIFFMESPGPVPIPSTNAAAPPEFRGLLPQPGESRRRGRIVNPYEVVIGLFGPLSNTAAPSPRWNFLWAASDFLIAPGSCLTSPDTFPRSQSAFKRSEAATTEQQALR